jgi:hypothetical protein
MPRARELPRDEPSDEPAADYREIGPPSDGLIDPVQFDVSISVTPRSRKETKYAIPTVLALWHITRTKSAERETGPAAASMQKRAPDGKDNYWKRLEEWRGCRAFSGNFPRRYYPDRVQRVSLSLAELVTGSGRRCARSTPVSSKVIRT